jgi:hypothetical protein
LGNLTSGELGSGEIKLPEGRSLKVDMSRLIIRTLWEVSWSLDQGEEHVPHEKIYVSKDTWRNQMMTSVKVS